VNDVTVKVDVSDYTASNEWEIVSHPAQKNIKYYSCCTEPYPDLTFTVSCITRAVLSRLMYYSLY